MAAPTLVRQATPGFGGQQDITCYTFTIANGQTLSDSIDLAGQYLLGVRYTAGIATGTLVPQHGGIDGTTFLDMAGTDGTALSLTTAAGTAKHHVIDPKARGPMTQTRFRASAAVTAALTIEVYVTPNPVV